MKQDEIRAWTMDRWERVAAKTAAVSQRIGADFPETAKADGKYTLMPHLSAWTNGFWPGMMWLMYDRSRDERYLEIARACEKKLDEILAHGNRLAHDVGFMWTLTAIADYKLTDYETAKERAIAAAYVLMGRFNVCGRFFRSWGDLEGKDTRGWTIADNMMNLPLLYCASEQTGDPRFRMMAEAHTETVMKHLVRPDGSANHIIKLDLETGELADNRDECLEFTQGCGLDSAWTRGQAWVLYGLVLGYIHTKREDFLNKAKTMAHYFIAALDESGVPPIDFRSGSENKGMDSSAGAIAACALIEIANCVPELEKGLYLNGAMKILKGLDQHCADYSPETDNVLKHAATHYRATDTRDIGLIYADYYYLEALYKLSGGTVLFW